MVESGVLAAVVYEIARQNTGVGANDHSKTMAVLRQWLDDRDELARHVPLITIQYHRAMRQDWYSRLVAGIERPLLLRSPVKRRLRMRG